MSVDTCFIGLNFLFIQGCFLRLISPFPYYSEIYQSTTLHKLLDSNWSVLVTEHFQVTILEHETSGKNIGDKEVGHKQT